MKVHELLIRLSTVDPDAVVLFLDEYADASDVDEINEIVVTDESWTCERHVSPGGRVDVFHHPTAHGLTIGWNGATDSQWEETVVVLSSGPTNLRYER